jgi:SnoaL-like domain
VSRDLADVVRDYVAAWNEPEDAARERLLRQSVADDVVMAPGYKPDAAALRGRDELSAEIGAMIAGRPAGGEYRLTPDDAPHAHHGWARFRWRVADPSGAVLTVDGMAVAGLDVVHAGEDGRLDTILVFLG